jgi:hypothetical protein
MRTRGRFLLRLGVLALAGTIPFIIQCGRDSSSSERETVRSDAGPQKADEMILVVEGISYKNSDFDRYVRDSLGGLDQELSAESLSRLFDKFVEERLLLEAARQQNVSLTWEEKKNYLAKLARESIPTDPVSPAGGRSDGQAFDKLLIEKYTYQVVKDIRVDEQEIRTYYQAHKRDFLLPERVRVSQILLDSEDKAVDVLRRLENASREDFRRVAQEDSIGPEAQRGGEMGIFKAGDLPYEMERVVFSLEPGKLSRVFESSYGYHIFWVDAKYQPELVSENDAASSIRLKIIEQKIKDAVALHIEGLKERMEWRILPESLTFSYQRTTI